MATKLGVRGQEQATLHHDPSPSSSASGSLSPLPARPTVSITLPQHPQPPLPPPPRAQLVSSRSSAVLTATSSIMATTMTIPSSALSSPSYSPASSPHSTATTNASSITSGSGDEVAVPGHKIANCKVLHWLCVFVTHQQVELTHNAHSPPIAAALHVCVRIDETGSLVWLRLKRSARVKDVKDGLFTRLGVPSAMQVNTKSQRRALEF